MLHIYMLRCSSFMQVKCNWYFNINEAKKVVLTDFLKIFSLLYLQRCRYKKVQILPMALPNICRFATVKLTEKMFLKAKCAIHTISSVGN